MKGLIVTIVVLISLSANAQYYPIRIAERTYTTLTSFSGIDCKSITPLGDNCYSVEFYNNNYNEPNDITTYSFDYYLSYRGKRISDYYKMNIKCRRSETVKVYMWPDGVSNAYARYVTVQFGKEPAQKDSRDDD